MIGIIYIDICHNLYNKYIRINTAFQDNINYQVINQECTKHEEIN